MKQTASDYFFKLLYCLKKKNHTQCSICISSAFSLSAKLLAQRQNKPIQDPSHHHRLLLSMYSSHLMNPLHYYLILNTDPYSATHNQCAPSLRLGCKPSIESSKLNSTPSHQAVPDKSTLLVSCCLRDVYKAFKDLFEHFTRDWSTAPFSNFFFLILFLLIWPLYI